MLKRIAAVLVAPLLALAMLSVAPLTPTAAAPATAESVQRPTHSDSSLSLFSCAATRPSGFTSATVLHSHRIAAASTVDFLGNPEIDAFDCEVQNPGSPGPEATYRTDYIYSNVDDGTNGGHTDKGIIGPFNVQRF